MTTEKAAAPHVDIQLSADPLSPDTCLSFVADDGAGGIVTFLGMVRDHTQQRRVLRLEYEAYAPMAIAEMKKLAAAAAERWPIRRLLIHHRTGTLSVGDIAVVIAVATPHRAEAFAACQFLIDTLKETVPIWKKEIFEDGETWVAAHP